MKTFLFILLVIVMVASISACGDTRVINGVEYDTFGLFNKYDNKNPGIKYKVIVGNVVWACILAETVAAPIYFLGFSLYEPVGIKSNALQNGYGKNN